MRRFVYLAVLLPVFPAAAQEPRIRNVRLETRAVSPGALEREFSSLVNQPGPVWIGYEVPSLAGRQSCCYSCCAPSACALEGGKPVAAAPGPAAPVMLEPSGRLLVLYRVEQRAVGKVRSFSGDCELDAGGLPFVWLNGVRPAESVSLLASQAGVEKLRESSMAAIALHADAAADQALERFVAADQPERARERAAFWLGSARGQRGLETLRRVVPKDASERFREKAVFAFSTSKEPEAVNDLVGLARNDQSGRVRGQALFWLAKKAGDKAAAMISEALEKDPETEVKKRAVFALSQLPKDEGVPLLIQAARTHPNREVRRQAFFWLGRSKDPRALAFFEQVLAR